MPMRDDESPRIVLITHPPEGADAFARRLVGERIAACVSRLPVVSTFRWKGAIEEEEEVLLVAKITARGWEALEEALDRHHPYDVPECVALEPDRVEARYLAWLQAETGP